MGQEGISAVGRARAIETQWCHTKVFDSSTWTAVKETEEMCKVFHEYFTQLFERGSGPKHREDFVGFFTVLLCLLGREAVCWEGPITAVKVEEVLSECGGDKSLGLDGLPYELYYNMPDLFGHLLACIYTNWQQNGLIPRSVSQRLWCYLERIQTRGT